MTMKSTMTLSLAAALFGMNALTFAADAPTTLHGWQRGGADSSAKPATVAPAAEARFVPDGSSAVNPAPVPGTVIGYVRSPAGTVAKPIGPTVIETPIFAVTTASAAPVAKPGAGMIVGYLRSPAS